MGTGTPARETPSRAGTYVRQASGYRAFIPAALPPEPPVRLDGQVQALLSEADRALGRLDGSIQTLPNPDLFVFMYVRKEAVLSSQIKGTQSSLQDVLAGRGPAPLREPAARRLRGAQLRRRHEPRISAARRAAIVDATDPRDPREAARRGARLAPDTGRAAAEPELDRAGRLHAGQATFVPPPPHAVPAALGRSKRSCTRPTTVPAARSRSVSPMRSSRPSTRSSTAMAAWGGC